MTHLFLILLYVYELGPDSSIINIYMHIHIYDAYTYTYIHKHYICVCVCVYPHCLKTVQTCLCNCG